MDGQHASQSNSSSSSCWPARLRQQQQQQWQCNGLCSYRSNKQYLLVVVCLVACFVLQTCFHPTPPPSDRGMSVESKGEAQAYLSVDTFNTLDNDIVSSEPLVPEEPQGNHDSNKIIPLERQQESSAKLCDRLASKNIHELWPRVLPSILNVSLPDEPGFDTVHNRRIPSLRDDARFQQWTRESSCFFDSARLATSQIFPANPEVTQELVRIIEHRWNDPQNNPPLKIAIFGGSVPAGSDSATNPFDVTIKEVSTRVFWVTRYSNRLQDMLDALLGEGTVQVTNLAFGAALTQYSTAMIESGLFPEGFGSGGPDVILWDHGANELTWGNKVHTLSEFHAATRLLAVCRETQQASRLPAVIYLDSVAGIQIWGNMKVEQTLSIDTAISELTSWYQNAMGISYGRVIRHYALLNYQNTKTLFPLLGNRDLFLHPGMMYHIGIAWVLAFNILNSFATACSIQTAADSSSSDTNDSVSMEQSNGAFGKDNVASVQDIPSLDFLPPFKREPETTKMQFLPFQGEPDLTNSVVRPFWLRRQYDKHKLCNSKSQLGAACPFRMIVHGISGIQSQEEMREKMNSIVTFNDGWAEDVVAVGKPILGWDAKKAKAVFEMEYRVPIMFNRTDGQTSATSGESTGAISSISMIFMKSYSERWVGSNLHVIIRVVSNHSNSAENAATPKRNFRRRRANQAIAEFVLEGYHKEATSILVPHKVEIPPAEPGDLIRGRFTLTGGQTFKISGLSFCS